jgi:hypothetical protein
MSDVACSFPTIAYQSFNLEYMIFYVLYSAAPISRGMKCKVCKTSVHTKCQQYIPYCCGVSRLDALPLLEK